MSNLIKVKIKDEDTSKKIQNHAFELKFFWYINGREIQWTDKEFLYFDWDTKLITAGDSLEVFESHDGKKLSPDEFLKQTI